MTARFGWRFITFGSTGEGGGWVCEYAGMTRLKGPEVTCSVVPSGPSVGALNTRSPHTTQITTAIEPAGVTGGLRIMMGEHALGIFR